MDLQREMLISRWKKIMIVLLGVFVIWVAWDIVFNIWCIEKLSKELLRAFVITFSLAGVIALLIALILSIKVLAGQKEMGELESEKATVNRFNEFLNIKACEGHAYEFLNRIGYATLTMCIEEDSKSFNELIEKINFSEPTLHSAWFKAAQSGSVNVMSCMIEKKLADKDLENSIGETAAHVAVLSRRAEVLEYLKSIGADLAVKDNSEKTPYDYVDHTTEQLLAILPKPESTE